LILRFECIVDHSHLTWAIYKYTKDHWPPKNPREVEEWLQRLILRYGTMEFSKTVREFVPPNGDHSWQYAELMAREWWNEN
jgi:hypothetical protein